MSTQSRPGLLITRPQRQAQAFAAALDAAHPGKWTPVLAPLLAIRPTGAQIDLAGIHSLIFTSANAVRAVAAEDRLRGLPALCAGAATAEAARNAGMQAQAVAGDAQGLLTALTARILPGPGAYLHLTGTHMTMDLSAALRQVGIGARQLVVYDQAAQNLPADVLAQLAEGSIAGVTLFSPRTAQIFAAQLGGAVPQGLRMFCLSRAVGTALNLPGAHLVIAPTANLAGMLSRL